MGKPKKPRRRLIQRLPEEVMESIALKLYEAADLLRFSMISKHWYNHIHSNSFWERHPASSRLMLCCMNRFLNFRCVHLPHDLPTSYDDLPDSTIYKWFNNLNLQTYNPEIIGNVASSDGLLCIQYFIPRKHEDAEINTYDTYIHLFDPFRSSVPMKVLHVPDNLLAFDETPVTLHFKVYSLTHTYIIILGISKDMVWASQRGYLIYRSSTGKWEKSQFIKIRGYSSDAEVFMGDSLYYVYGGLRYIHKYTLSTESWSRKQIAKGKAPEVVTDGMVLFFNKGKLMIIAPADERLQVWKAVEKKHKYIFTKISLHEPSYDHGAYFYYWPDYDLVLIQLVALVTKSEKLVRGLTVYRPSTSSWHYIDRPANFEGNHYFVSETKWLFLRPL